MPAKAKQAPKEITKEQLTAVVKRLEGGASALIDESKKLGFSDNTRLRAALREFLGGRGPYERLITKGMKARTALRREAES